MLRFVVILWFALAAAFQASAAEELRDIIMNSKAESMRKANLGAVVYPHHTHAEMFECEFCHPQIFKEKIGANEMTMMNNMEGMYCGTAGYCHSRMDGLPMYFCEGCHLKLESETAPK